MLVCCTHLVYSADLGATVLRARIRCLTTPSALHTTRTIHTHTLTHMHTHTRTHTHTHTRTHTRTRARAHACTHTHTHAHKHTCTHEHTLTHTYTHTHAYARAYTHTRWYMLLSRYLSARGLSRSTLQDMEKSLSEASKSIDTIPETNLWQSGPVPHTLTWVQQFATLHHFVLLYGCFVCKMG